MSAQPLPDSQPAAGSSALLLKFSNLLILAMLVGIAGLLYSLNRKLDAVSHLTAATTAISSTPATAAEAAPAPAPAVRRAPARPAVNRNYTGAAREAASARPPHDHSVASVVTAQPAPAVAAPPQPIALPVPYPAPYPDALAPRTAMASLPQGTILTVRMIHSLSSDTSRPGDRFAASLDEPIYSGGIVAVPAGATVEGRVISAQQAGRVSGISELSVQLDRLQLPSGGAVSLATEVVSRQGETTRTQDATKVGVGTAIGAAIGAISGGRKGAGIGAATGAGAGTAGVLLTRGKPVILSPETSLSFSLAAPVQFEVFNYSQSTSAATPSNVAPVWPAPRLDSTNDPFDGQRPRLRRRML